MTSGFNLGESEEDYRVPDGGLHRPGATGVWHGTAALVTIHPSFLLRIKDEAHKAREYRNFTDDLRRAKKLISSAPAGPRLPSR